MARMNKDACRFLLAVNVTDTKHVYQVSSSRAAVAARATGHDTQIVLYRHVITMSCISSDTRGPLLSMILRFPGYSLVQVPYCLIS